jgi:hypothetical protein
VPASAPERVSKTFLCGAGRFAARFPVMTVVPTTNPHTAGRRHIGGVSVGNSLERPGRATQVPAQCSKLPRRLCVTAGEKGGTCCQRSTASSNDSVTTDEHPHGMSSVRRVGVAGVVAVMVALAPPGVASADNSNNNTNNNDVTNVGDPSDMSARPNESTSWPPADLSWPPTDFRNSGSEAAKPIVPVDAP